MCGPGNHMNALSDHNDVLVIILIDTSDHKVYKNIPNNELQQQADTQLLRY